MNEEDKLLLFMPIIQASLTNAVYTCQLLNPEMKDNPEAAIAHVLLTSQRMDELLRSHFVQKQNKKISLAQLIQSASSQTQQRQKELAALSPTPPILEELRFLDMKAAFLVEMSNLLISASS